MSMLGGGQRGLGIQKDLRVLTIVHTMIGAAQAEVITAIGPLGFVTKYFQSTLIPLAMMIMRDGHVASDNVYKTVILTFRQFLDESAIRRWHGYRQVD